LGVNYDPANLLMNGFDPVANLAPLKDRIVHTHAKDARPGGASRTAQEVPIGHGDIDWMLYLGTLSALEYNGWVVIERESGTNRAADVAAGVSFLRRLL
jgi:sugar phosphate isomerase/epimerase